MLKDKVDLTDPDAVRFVLVHAVTAYDRRQAAKASYNCYALPQYLAAVEEIADVIRGGMPMREAICRKLSGRLLDACLREVGEPKATREEHNLSLYY
jgi:hypothetical protein